jgi:NADPH2:quinone reductase
VTALRRAAGISAARPAPRADSAEPVSGRAVVAPRHGAPEVLEVHPWSVPPPGPGQVRIRVEAAGISYADLLICQGLHPERRRAPFVPGWDVVGAVESVGSEVDHVRVGDRVAALTIVGGWAEYAVVPGRWVVPVPDGLPSTTAVCLVMDAVVAYQMLTRSTPARPGDTVLVQGAGGGVGTALLQVARHLGVRVLGTDRAAKRAHVEAEGGVLIDFAHEDVVARCRELTGGRGVAQAFDGTGDTVLTSLRAVRPGGRLVWFGMVSLLAAGRREWRSALRTLGRLGLALAGNLRPGGKRTTVYSIQSLARRHPDWYRADLATLFTLLTDGTITPRIAAVHTLDEAPAALATLTGSSPPGKQVIAVRPDAPDGRCPAPG